MSESPDIIIIEEFPVTIIGCSGRNERITLEMYTKAKEECVEYIKSLPYRIEDIILQSGGSSGIDHLAIILFLEGIDGENFRGLNLFLPCQFNFENGEFFHNNKYEESSSKMLNELHKKFSKNIDRDSLKDFKKIKKKKNVNFYYGLGFYARNRMLAKNTNIPESTTIAMTYGKGDNPNDGGTRYTWDLIEANKKHFTLYK